MLITETRTCSECKNFRQHLGGFPICIKKLMGVTAGMYVTYKESEGTCFEETEGREEPK